MRPRSGNRRLDVATPGVGGPLQVLPPPRRHEAWGKRVSPWGELLAGST
ncbi:hypothetical protein [Myxococcus sp. CA039A]|nr:hypothetical protein [Myxococcus sp. CA039A]NTX54343.1 hypothetical protein [Myxococcus sp. CA039A]